MFTSVPNRPHLRTAYSRPVDIKKLDFIHRNLEVFKAKTVLELGCGDGSVAMTLTDYESRAVDISADELSVAATRGVRGILGDAMTYLDGKKYDAVILSEVIEHVMRPDLAFESAARNLVPGGVLIVTTPNGYGFYELMHTHLNWRSYIYRSNFIRKVLGKRPFVPGNTQAHCQWFLMSRVLKIAQQAGFDLAEQANSDFVTGSKRDVAFADRIPFWAASGWFFSFRLRDCRP